MVLGPRNILPRSTWAYGKGLLDGIFNIETVLLHQNDVISKGREDCHHLTVCIVGAAAAGKTSLIRKLTGENFHKEHVPTELMDTCTVRPVKEQYVQTQTWRKCEQSSDTDEVIAHSVNNTLSDTCNNHKRGLLPHCVRLFILMATITLTCFSFMAHGAQPLACICFSIAFGFVCLGANDTGMRMALGYVTMVYMIVGLVADRFYSICDNTCCSHTDLLHAVLPALPLAMVWGILTGFGLNPGMASGLALLKMISTKAVVLDSIYPASSEMFTMQSVNHSVFLYWIGICACSFFGCHIGSMSQPKTAILILVILMGFGSIAFQVFDLGHISVSFLFPPTVFCCWLVGISSLPLGRNLAPEQNPAGIQKMDLVRSLLGAHVPGIFIGVLIGYGIIGGQITVDIVNDYFVSCAILVLIFILCKSCPIYQYFSSPDDKKSTNMSRNNAGLHNCFKLLVRDFAGQTIYHSIHQPFLPRYGLFVCAFSWEKARLCSLRFAIGSQDPEKTPESDQCLQDILFWLKNISMHRAHPNQHIARPTETDSVDANDIKDIVLVATHSQSCGLTHDQKQQIMLYYKRKIREHKDIYASIEFRLSSTGEISVENSDISSEVGISKLKQYLVKTAQQVITHCFPNPIPVYFWCWLKEKRDVSVETDRPPCEKFVDSHIDSDGRYMPVYPTDRFQKMIDVFCDIGEIFLVTDQGITEKQHKLTDTYIFYDIQFLIDFMKDIVNINERKETDRLMGSHWKGLKVTGRSNKQLLEHQLNKFYNSKNMKQMFAHHKIEEQPLVKSMHQLDFIFFVGDEFFLPQLLPSSDRNTNIIVSEVDELLWEYVFDFHQFDYHHEYVFFRLLTRCAGFPLSHLVDVCHDYVSFYVSPTSLPSAADTADESLQLFTLSCEKYGRSGGQHNRIYLRAFAHYDPDQSRQLLHHVKEGVIKITDMSFPKLGGKLTHFFNCPNRRHLTSTHQIVDTSSGIPCGAACKQNQNKYMVRLDQHRLPYLSVSDGVKDWLCVQLDDEEFNSLLSYLLNINITRVRQKYTPETRNKEEIKTDLLYTWTEGGYKASFEKLCEALTLLELIPVLQRLISKFP